MQIVDLHFLLLCQFIKTKLNKLSYLGLIVRIACLVVTMCDDAAHCAGIVTEMSSKSRKRLSFHLKVGHLPLTEAEALECIKHIRHCKRYADNSSLRAIEA